METFSKSYKILSTVGKGNFSTVKKAIHLLTNETVAIKVVNKIGLLSTDLLQLSQEIGILKLFKHTNIIRLYETFEDSNSIYIVLEFGICDLSVFIQKYFSKNYMEESRIRNYFLQILSALFYCHNHRIIHCDLKPENILLFNDYQLCKIADFGLSRFLKNLEHERTAGTIEFMAPETLISRSNSTEKSDIWSVGVILYIMACSENPFHHENINEIMVNIIDCKYCIPKHVPKGCRQIIKKILIKDPKKRISVEEIIKMPWFVLSNTKIISYLELNTTITINQEIHDIVVNRMIEKSIATLEEINQSLFEDKSDNISACYFLTAESLVRSTLNLDFSIKLNVDKSLLCPIHKNMLRAPKRSDSLRISLMDLTKNIDKNKYMKSNISYRSRISSMHDLRPSVSNSSKDNIFKKTSSKFFSDINLVEEMSTLRIIQSANQTRYRSTPSLRTSVISEELEFEDHTTIYPILKNSMSVNSLNSINESYIL